MSDETRRDFATTLCTRTRVATPRLIDAFAAVPRESFFDPGPWSVLKTPSGYRVTPDDDPHHLYRDLTIAIDPERGLHNGQPSLIALLIHHLELSLGDRVVHIGSGLGYYSAVLAQLVGSEGQVLALELDRDLAVRARRNLADWKQVEVLEEDGTAFDFETADAILVHAGVTRPPSSWLEDLELGGRLVFPLTDREGRGGCLRVVGGDDQAEALEARFILYGGAFPCAGSRSGEEAERLGDAFAGGGWENVRSLRREEHREGESCWSHEPGFCLSKRDTVEPP